MKIRRYKKAVKHLNFYVNTFGFHKPYQVLIDGTFCFAALQNGVQIAEEIPKYLGGEVKLLTTSCIVLETEKLGHKVRGAMQITKLFSAHKCSHGKNAVSGSACLRSMVGSDNNNRYIIATQDKQLREVLQNMIAVPVLYFNRTSVVLKPPSDVTMSAAEIKRLQSVAVNSYQERILDKLKKEAFGDKEMGKDANEDSCFEPIKKRKGPNPLSCKKKTVKIPQPAVESSISSNKQKRRRKRIPKHVKELIRKEICNSK